LRALGHYGGELHGRLDADTEGALRSWAGMENLEERLVTGGRIDPVVLDFLRERYQASEPER